MPSHALSSSTQHYLTLSLWACGRTQHFQAFFFLTFIFLFNSASLVKKRPQSLIQKNQGQIEFDSQSWFFKEKYDWVIIILAAWLYPHYSKNKDIRNKPLAKRDTTKKKMTTTYQANYRENIYQQFGLDIDRNDW